MEVPQFTRAVTWLAVSAMLAVQLSGGIARYSCDYSGRAIITFEPHCHGGEAGHHHGHHDDGLPTAPCSPEDFHHHELVLTPNQALEPTLISAPPVSSPSLCWTEIESAHSLPAPKQCRILRIPPDHGGPPSLHLLVGSSIVLLI